MTNYSRQTLVILLTLALGVGSLTALAVPAQDSTIRGRVFESDFRTPVSDLAVQVFAQGAEAPLAEAATDRSGRFRLSDLPAGSYLLVMLDQAGTPLATAPVTTRAGESNDMALALPGENAMAPASAAAGSWIAGPLGASVVLVGTAVVVAVVGDELTADNPEREDLVPPSPDQP